MKSGTGASGVVSGSKPSQYLGPGGYVGSTPDRTERLVLASRRYGAYPSDRCRCSRRIEGTVFLVALRSANILGDDRDVVVRPALVALVLMLWVNEPTSRLASHPWHGI